MSRELTLQHRPWRLLPAAPPVTAVAPVSREGVIMVGELSRASGLGEGARLMLRGLASLGVPAWPLDIGPSLPGHTADLPLSQSAAGEPPAGAALVLHVNPPPVALVLARLPRALVRNRRIVGFWVWELPVALPEWCLGACFVHDAWAPSRFAAEAPSPLVSGRMREAPYRLAILPPEPAPLSRADFGLSETALVVSTSFNLASSFERKNPLGAVAAFRAAFGDRADRLLVLKVGNPLHSPPDFARLSAAVAGATNIRLETRTMSPADALALTAIADLVLSLHRSERFGLVPAEASLLGRTAIATGWPGNMKFIDERSAALVRYRLVAAADPRGVYAVPDAVWAEPDVTHAAEWQRRLASDAPARPALGAAAQIRAWALLGPAARAWALRGLGESRAE